MIDWLIMGAIVAAVVLDLLLLWWFRRRKSQQGGQSGQDNTGISESRWRQKLRAFKTKIIDWISALRSSLTKSWKLSLDEWRKLRANEFDLLRASFVLGAFLVSASIGYMNADKIMVRGWQLWLWLGCIAITLVAMMTNPPPRLRLQRQHIALAGLLLVAALLRITWLDKIPPGLHVDEAGTADFTLRHVYPRPDLTISPFRTGPNFMPSLYYYVTWSSMMLFGQNMIGLRLSSALAGSVALLATYGLIAQVANKRTAWIATALMAFYHYHIHWSRIGLSNIWDTVFVPAAFAMMVWGWQSGWRGGSVLAGLILGLAQYFYPGNKIALPMLLILAYQLAKETNETPRMIRELSRLTASFGVVAGPIVTFYLARPMLLFGRFSEIVLWRPGLLEFPEASGGILGTIWIQFLRMLTGFTVLTDVTGFYGPGVPLVLGLAAPLFVVGIIWSWHKRRYLPLVWIGLAAVFAGFIIGGTPSSSHYVVAIPAISWLVATPLSELHIQGRRRLALFLLLLILLTDLGFYFGVYIPGGAHPHLIHPFPEIPTG